MRSTISLICVSIFVAFAVAALEGLKLHVEADSDPVVDTTALVTDAAKADNSGDISFYEKNLADDWTGVDSSGFRYTKKSFLNELSDTENNNTNSEQISDLLVRPYGVPNVDTAVATYRSSYDALVRGQHRSRTLISTDTFVKRSGQWLQVAHQNSQIQ